jgi:hypothetical protein
MCRTLASERQLNHQMYSPTFRRGSIVSVSASLGTKAQGPGFGNKLQAQKYIPLTRSGTEMQIHQPRKAYLI